MKKFFKNLMPMLLLVAGLGISPNAWAKTANFSLIGDPTGSWSTKWSINNNYSNWEKFYIEVYMSTNQYFAMHNGTSRYAPSTNGADPSGYGTYNENNAWKYSEKNGIVRVCVDQTAGDNGDWYPYIWIERPEIKLHHTWNKSTWTQEGPMTDKQDGTYTMDHNYSGSSNGYSYYGWYEGTHMSSDNGNLTRNPSTIAEGAKCQFLFNSNNMTLTITRYDKITYNANNATSGSVPSATEALYNTKATIAGNTGSLQRTGFSFAGWNTKADGSGTTYKVGDEYTMNGDVTLYAKWVVSLTVAKGTGIYSVEGSKSDIAVGSQHAISATPATGYHFGQWTASPAANAEFTDATQASTNVTVKNGSVTVTATGALNSYDIHYPDAEAQANGHFTISNQTNSGNYTTTANFTATPEKGYRLAVTATYGSNVNVPLTHDDLSYNYSFTIPAGDVTIAVKAYRYGLAYSLSSGGFDESGVVRFDGNDQIVLSNLAAHSVYKFKLYNEAYTSDNNSHFMGNAGAWQIYKNENNMVPSIGVECFYINTGSDGNYVISLGDNNNNKPSINITYPDVCKINIDNHDYALTQVGETNIYETGLITLNRNVNYYFYLYWHGPRLGDQYGNIMTNTNHTGWNYQSQYYNIQSILSTYNTPKTAKYKFQFDASNNKLTVIYPSAISGGFPDQDWNDNYTLVFDGNVGTRTISLVQSQSPISFKVVDDGVFYGAQNTNITATQENIALIPSDESSYDMKLTPSVDGQYTFTYDRSTHKLSVEYPASTQTYDVTVYQDGITPTTVNVGLTPVEITAVIPESMVFDQWVGVGAVIINSPSSATTTITATGAGASVRAVFKTQNTIYFKDNAGWNDVWLNFYSGEYWNNDTGSGAKGIQHTGDNMHATKIDNTDIWYFNKSDYDDWTSGIMAYTNKNAAGHDHFNFVNCSYFDGIRGKSKYDDRTPLFVPRNFITDYKNQSQYYLEGIWMKYNSTESGFDLRGKNTTKNDDNSITWDDRNHKFTAPTPGEYTFSTTIHLKAAQTYEMRIYDAAERWYSLNGNTMTATSCTNWKLHLKNDGNFRVTTTAEGDYVFTISVGGGEMLLTITYPLSDNDYRVVYVEDETTQTNGYLVKKISEGTQKDTASFFIATGATGQVKLQQCTNASTQTWADVSPAQSISVSGYKNGVHNFIVSQNGSSATLSAGGEYTGNFYIRTEGVDGGKEGFKSNADNKLTAYASMLDAGVTYSNFQYNYYKTKWVSSGKNVSFCVANDYSKNISSEFRSDAIIDPVQTPTKETLPQSANVRFMWNSETNTLSRAYISGSTDISARFLVLEGDAKMFDKDGKALSITGLSPNEINFTDKNNWVYQADIKAQPGCAVKLTAKYNNQIQYFLGSSETSHQIISGSGSTQYTMRVVYDFKTNRLTAGWVPEKNQPITDPIELGGDMLLVREHQGDANQITFGDDGEVTNIKHIYGVLTIRKDTMLGVANTRYTEAATNADYSRTMYWISFPFKVKISEIFGLDGYGQKWIIQKYNGKKRADIGWFKEDTPTFWEFMDESDSLNAYEGYLFLIDATYFNKSTADVWGNSATEVNFYFPSANGEIGIIKSDTYPQDVDAHACGIDREFEVDGVQEKLNHMITDSYWNVIGVPAFQNTTASAAPVDGGLKAYYEWVPATNTYKAKVTMDGVTFKTMHAYMVQFGGTLTWSDVSVVSNQAPYQYADNKNYRIELFFGNGEAEDHAYINLADGVSTDFVLNEDMMKIDNAGYPNIYSFAGAYNVAYNETKMIDQVVTIGVSAPKDGSYTFSMPKDFSGSAILVDLEEGTATDLNVSNYSVDLNKGTYNNRFQLMLKVEASTPTNIDNVDGGEWNADGKTKKLLINDQIYLINGGRVYNVLGVEE